ncbi:hypothetical protein [uncultured Paracoccus sp.]|uniref:YncE family protein n=1 Tax=uncultured Paracoccus sp. TaxID=189685 RepID=UPI0025D05725|nr:hypothetical protein [uncultured Paracoccus sp.]
MTTIFRKDAMRPAGMTGRATSRLLLAPVLAGGLALVAVLPAQAQETAENGWRYHVEAIGTGVNDGFELALDPVAGRVYVADAAWRSEARDTGGDPWLTQTASGKLVVFDSANRSFVGVHSFLDLSRTDGSGTERDPLDWSGVDSEQETTASMRATFSPYGVAVDGTTTGADGQPDATIVTTTARGRDPQAGYGGHMVIYNASQGAPSDDDRLWQFEDGSPIFEGMRRVVVNTQTHKAYVSNIGQRGDAAERRPGFVAVVDLPSKTVEARVPLPDGLGVIGVAVDEENGLVYAGALNGENLFVFDAGEVDTSNPQDLALNADLPRLLEQAEVGANARPEYDPATKRLYVAAFGEPGKITVIDADPASADYGSVVNAVETGSVNAVTVDADRGLLFSANLGDKEVVVHDLDTLDVVLRVPTSGEPINTAIDPTTGDIWVAHAKDTGKLDVITLKGSTQ